jgi:predicted MFS family arabinose efflux permease
MMKAASRKILLRIRPSNELVIGWLTMFVIGSDLFVISPLLPLIAADYAISPALAGLSVTVFSASYMLSAPILGHMADRNGRARVVTYCLFAFAVSNIFTMAAGNLTILLASRCFAGAAAAGVSPSIYALIASSAPSGQRATRLSIVVSGLLISLSFGAPIGALIGASLSWRIVFAGLSTLSLLLVWANNRIWADRRAAAPTTAGSGRLAISAVIPQLAPTVVWSTAVYAMYTYLGGGLTSLGYSTKEIAGAIVFYGSGAIAGVLIGGRMTDRLGAGLTKAVGLSGLCCCFLLLRFSLDAGVLVDCAFGALSLMAQLFFPAQQFTLAQEFPAKRASILAWNNSALFLGISLGSLVGGQAISVGGFDSNLMISAVIAFVGWIINRGNCSARDSGLATRQSRPSDTRAAKSPSP